MSWCYQCGVESRPTPAVAWDEDGEPACVGHAVKAERPLNLSPEALAIPLQNLKQPTGRLNKEMLTPELLEKVREPNQIAKVATKMFQQPAAAPSPVQTSAKEKFMGGKEKQCPCGCGTMFTATGNRQVYAPGHKPAQVKKIKSKTGKTSKAKTVGDLLKPGALIDATKGPALDPIPVPLQLEDIAPLMPGMNERVIHFYLGESKVQKLLNLLLAD